jgi:hypothetical protein
MLLYNLNDDKDIINCCDDLNYFKPIEYEGFGMGLDLLITRSN